MDSMTRMCVMDPSFKFASDMIVWMSCELVQMWSELCEFIVL